MSLAGNNLLQWLLFTWLLMHGALLMPQEQAVLAEMLEWAANMDADITDAYALCEDLQDLESEPVNLNTASLAQLTGSGLFTPYQASRITAHRERYGSFLSIFELGTLPGFRTDVLLRIAPFIEAGPAAPNTPSGRPATRALVRLSGKFPVSEGFRSTGNDTEQPAFAGSVPHAIFKIRHSSGKGFDAGLAYEKDPGETTLWNHFPEYLSGYLSRRGTGVLNHIIAGTYRLNHGMGLLHGSGSFLGPGPADVALLSDVRQIPYAGTGSSKQKQGLLVRLRFPHLSLTAWSSCRSLDLSLQGISADHPPADWTMYHRASGLHRTSTEINGRGLGLLAQAGIHAGISIGPLHAGVQWSSDRSNLSRRGMDSLGIRTIPTVYHSGSVHWTWRPGTFLLRGELAATNEGMAAFILHTRVHFNDFLTAGFQIHRYPPGFRDFSSSCYASGSRVRNETGILLYLNAEPAPELMADMTAEILRHPAPRQQSEVPSSQFRFRLNLSNRSHHPVRWQLRISGKTWQETEPSGLAGPRLLVRHSLCGFDARFGIISPGHLEYFSRIIATLTGPGHRKGVAVVQQAGNLRPDWLRIRLQFVVFDIPVWNGRIYLYEPGMYHQFNFPVYNGTGQKITMVLGISRIRPAVLEARISATHHQHADHLGSGDHRVNGNMRWEAGMQIRIRI